MPKQALEGTHSYADSGRIEVQTVIPVNGQQPSGHVDEKSLDIHVVKKKKSVCPMASSIQWKSSGPYPQVCLNPLSTVDSRTQSAGHTYHDIRKS